MKSRYLSAKSAARPILRWRKIDLAVLTQRAMRIVQAESPVIGVVEGGRPHDSIGPADPAKPRPKLRSVSNG